MTKFTAILIALVLGLAATAHADVATTAFLKKHCIRCHGSDDQSADRRFDTLAHQIKSLNDLERYQEIVDQLNLGNMPPEDEPQPSDAERAKMVGHLTR